MNLKQRLTEDMKTAMRQRDADTLSVIRLANAAIKQFEVDERCEADDARIVTILNKMIKQRKDSTKIYAGAGRADLAAKEQAETAVLLRYLPEMLSADDIRREVAAALEETGASAPADIGKVMPLLKTRLHGKADMGEVNRILRESLAA